MAEERVKYLLGARARQLRALRERAELDEFKIRVLSAFLYAMVLREGTQRVSASDISKYLDTYQLVAARVGDDYLLSIGTTSFNDPRAGSSDTEKNRDKECSTFAPRSLKGGLTLE